VKETRQQLRFIPFNMYTRHNHPIVGSKGKAALLVEGGALRGPYAVGVLRTLHEFGGPNQFDAIVAVSSGVFASTYFAAGQVEEMESTWRNLVHGSQLISFRRRLKGEPILGVNAG
jgi:predicted acylesterase/phospholipase RssA